MIQRLALSVGQQWPVFQDIEPRQIILISSLLWKN